MNQRGDAFIMSLILAATIATVGLSAQLHYRSFTKQSMMTLRRSGLTALEASVRKLALQPQAYKCGADAFSSTDLSDARSISGVGSCVLQTAFFSNVMSVPVAGAPCAAGVTGCGYKTTLAPLTTQGQIGKFAAKIVYDGADYQLRPIDIQMDIPSDILQSSAFDCASIDGNFPVFVGFKANGSADCRGFNNGLDCPQGSYATVVNFDSLTVTCRPLNTADKVVNCGGQTFIGSYRWDNGVVTASCLELPPAPWPQ